MMNFLVIIGPETVFVDYPEQLNYYLFTVNVLSYQYRAFLILALLLFPVLLYAMIRSVLRRKQNEYWMPVFLYLLGAAGFLITNSLELFSAREAFTLMWGKLSYLFIPFIPLLWLNFVVRHVHISRGVGVKVLLPLLVVPCITVFFIFMPATTQLIWQDYSFIPREGLLSLNVEHGIWFIIFSVYNYILVIVLAVMLVRAYVQLRKVYIRRSFYILIGIFIPIILNLVYVFNLLPGLIKDYTPIGYSVSSLFLFLGVSRFNIFSIVPMARSLLVEYLSDGIVVLDHDGTIIDANPSAVQYLGIEEKSIGIPFPGNPFLSGPLQTILTQTTAGDMVFLNPDRAQHLRFEYTPVQSRSHISGYLVVIKDITDTEEAIKKAEDLAYSDPLTGVFNRRYLNIIGDRLLSLAARQDKNLTLAVLDLDNFKKINDNFGHEAGDRVLVSFCRAVEREVRSGDIFARIGGEEFVLMMEGLPAEGAEMVCGRINQAVRELRFSSDPENIFFNATVSIGCADNRFRQITLTELMRNADRALYRAKKGSKDTTCVWTES